MNIYKSFVADTPVNVYWLWLSDHPTIDRVISDDGRQIHIDSEAYGVLIKKIKEELKSAKP